MISISLRDTIQQYQHGGLGKKIRTLCDESKVKLIAPLGQWTLDDNKYKAYFQWFLFHYI